MLQVELHLGTKSALLRMDMGGKKSVVTMLEPPSGVERSQLPHCYTAHWVGPYRVRPLSFVVEQVEETVLSATGEPFRITSEEVHAWVAVDEPTFMPLSASLRSPPLNVGESRKLWLTSTSLNCQKHTLVGKCSDDDFDLALHIMPLEVPCRGDEEDASFLYVAEIDLMRTGELESHGTIKVQESAKGEPILVGDHRVTIKKLHAPLSLKDTAGEREAIRSDYPVLILHVQVKVERIDEDEAQRHAWDTMFD